MKQKGKLGQYVRIIKGWDTGKIGKIKGIVKWDSSCKKRVEYKVAFIDRRHSTWKPYDESYYSYQFKIMTNDEVMVEKL